MFTIVSTIFKHHFFSLLPLKTLSLPPFLAQAEDKAE